MEQTAYERIMNDPCTRKLTFKIIELSKEYDPVDCLKDIELALQALTSKLDEMLTN